MFLHLPSSLALLIYPLGLACFLLAVALLVRRSPRWQSFLLALTLALLWLGGNRVGTMILVRTLEWQYLPPNRLPRADAIVVLGGATRAQAFPRPMHEFNEAGDRLLYAARLYQTAAAPRILLTGGDPTVGPEPHSEAEAMAEALVSMGVPREALLLETRSRNTYENAIEAKEILKREGIAQVILVTSALHMPRAYSTFRKQGMDAIPAPVDYLVTEADWNYYTQFRLDVQLMNLLPSARDLNWTTLCLKEYLGIAVYRLRGWL